MQLIVRQLSGLGNQMFQYAAGLFYAAQHDAQVILIIDPPHKSHSHGHPRPFLLSHFAIKAQHRDLSTFDRFVLMTANRRMRPTVRGLIQKALRVRIVTERLDQRFRFQAGLPTDDGVEAVYLLGYWQVHQIAERISADLRREFAFRTPATGRNLDVLNEIRNKEQSVSLHVRRGDYTLGAEGNVALSMEYYARAIEQVMATSSNPTFFVFSDDIKFARENLPRGITAVYIDHNGPSSAHEDLRLMSSCHHHIIANSTFSWWGAWLNTRRDKVVCAPRHWLVASCPAENDLIPRDWRLLD